MKKFEITLGLSRKSLVLESADDNMTIDEVMLMVAQQYGEEWYGCRVSCKDSFICNAVRSYYTGINDDGTPDEYYGGTEEDKAKSVYQHAMDNYVVSIKIAHGLCTKYYDWHKDAEVTCPTENVFSEN